MIPGARESASSGAGRGRGQSALSTLWFAAMSDATFASAADDASRGPRASWQVAGRVVLALAFAVILVAGVSQSWSSGRASSQQDFFQYWAVGRLAGTGVTDIYSDPARHTLARQIQTDAAQSGSTAAVAGAARWDVLETYGTPFLYALFGRLSTGDYDINSTAWQAISLLSCWPRSSPSREPSACRGW